MLAIAVVAFSQSFVIWFDSVNREAIIMVREHQTGTLAITSKTEKFRNWRACERATANICAQQLISLIWISIVQYKQKGFIFSKLNQKGMGSIFVWFSFNQNTVHQVNFIRLTDLHVDGDDKRHTCVTNSWRLFTKLFISLTPIHAAHLFQYTQFMTAPKWLGNAQSEFNWKQIYYMRSMFYRDSFT